MARKVKMSGTSSGKPMAGKLRNSAKAAQLKGAVDNAVNKQASATGGNKH